MALSNPPGSIVEKCVPDDMPAKVADMVVAKRVRAAPGQGNVVRKSRAKKPRLIEAVRPLSECPPVGKVNVQFNLEAVQAYLDTDLADILPTMSDRARLRRKVSVLTPREAIQRFMYKYVDQRALERKESLCFSIEYRRCKIGTMLVEAGLLQDSRWYGDNGCDTLYLDGRSSERILWDYINCDMKKAHPTIMLAITADEFAKATLVRFQQESVALLSDISRHYFGTDQRVQSIKDLINRLGMDGGITNWRVLEAVDQCVADHEFVLQYERAMPIVTEEISHLPHAARALNMLKENDPSLTDREARVLWKSFVLGSVEAMCRAAMTLAAQQQHREVGTQEHDGIRIKRLTRRTVDCKRPGGHVALDTVDPEQEATDNLCAVMSVAASRALSDAVAQITNSPAKPASITVVEKPPSVLPWDSATSRGHTLAAGSAAGHGSLINHMFLPRTQFEADNSYAWKRWELNRFFSRTSTKSMPLVESEFYPSTRILCRSTYWNKDQIAERFPFRSPRIVKVDPDDGTVTRLQEESLGMRWFRDPYVPSVRNIIFDPRPLRTETGDYNRFGGLPYDGLPLRDPDMKQIAPMLSHIRDVLASGITEHSEYLLNWHAYGLQIRDKTGTVPFLIGKQGLGKDIIYDSSSPMHYIFGRHHVQVCDFDQLLPKFNADMGEALLVIGDELSTQRPKDAERLKNAITCQSQRIEAKHVDPIHVQDYRNFILTSNSVDAAKIEEGDRRTVLLHCSEQWSQLAVDNGIITADDRQRYFANVLGAQLAHDDPPRRATPCEVERLSVEWYMYLMQRDISTFNPSRIPTSEFKKSVERLALDPLTRFLKDWADDQIEDCTEPLLLQLKVARVTALSTGITAKQISTLFQLWANDAKVTLDPTTAIGLGVKLGTNKQYVRHTKKTKMGLLWQLIPSQSQLIKDE
jgi:hypothetical protein